MGYLFDNMKKLLFIIAVKLIALTTMSELMFCSENTEQSIPVQGDIGLYLESIAHKESSNNYYAVGKYGHLGKYQFSASTLRGLGYDVDRAEFLDSPNLQEEAMIKLLLHNKQLLSRYIGVYSGREVGGVLVTESGVLAVAHLLGYSGALRFLTGGEDLADGLGTKASDYMSMFGGYELYLEDYEHNKY